MKDRYRLGLGAVAALTALCFVGTAGTATATLPMQKKAKAAGIPADNCLYCHNEKLPKKGAVSHNDRGKWLVEQKAAKKAKEADGAWLKDYKEPAK